MPTPIQSFRFENYRGFPDETSVAVRPLTLLFGYNNSGKSSITRFLPMLAESIEAARTPLLLDGEVLGRAPFQNVVCRQTQSRKLVMGIRLQDGTDASVTMRGERVEHEVEQVRVSGPVFAEWRVGDATRWRGWVPTSGAVGAAMAPIEDAVRDVQWIRGLRGAPARWIDRPGGLPFRVRSDGSDATCWIAAEGGRTGVYAADSLGGEVDRFFEAVGLRMSIEDRNDQFTVNLTGRGAEAVAIPLVDSGEGYVQVLPVLVAAARASRGVGPSLVAIEQPELHLHTHAQRSLGEWLARLAGGGAARMLVETHSEVLLTAVQLAVARHELDPARVAIYWTRRDEVGRCSVEPITMLEDGRLSGRWPTDVFSDVHSLTRALFEARRVQR